MNTYITILFLFTIRLIAKPTEEECQILTRIIPPVFPDKIFSITDHGAQPNQDCTDAIQKSILACHHAGGGKVVIPSGTWLTGAIHLKSKVNLHISEGATLRFLFDTKKYLPLVLTRFEGIECMNYSPLIYALDQENIAITGSGIIDGSASWDTWWSWNDREKQNPTKQVSARKILDQQGTAGIPVEQRIFGDGSFLRPTFLQPYRCKNILIENIHIINSPMWEINPVLCTNVTVRNVSVKSLGTNNDGCNPESCKDVLIEKCHFDTGDDCIAIKSGRNNDGRRINVASENIIVRDCTMKDGHGGITMGSEISGGVRNVYVSNCHMDSPNLDRAIRFKSNAVRGGIIENIHISDITIGEVKKAILSVEFDYEEGEKGEHKPTLRNIHIKNVSAEKSECVSTITAIPAAIIENITFQNCSFNGVKKKDTIRHASAPTYKNVRIERNK